MGRTKGIHDGHKERIRKRFAEFDDFEGFQEHEILELFLSYANPMRDTNETAHHLINKFKTFDRLFSATREELLSVNGVGEGMATYILMYRAMFQKYTCSKNTKKSKVYDREEMHRYISSLFLGETTTEILYMLCTSTAGKLLKTKLISRGDINSVHIDLRQVTREIFNCDAHGVIFAHNHPSGQTVPSYEDIETTAVFQKYFDMINVKLIDHVICSGDECVSVINDPRYKIRLQIEDK